MQHLFPLLLLCIVFSGCNNNSSDKVDMPSAPSATADYEKLSKAFCECAQPSIALNEKMQALSAEGKRDEFVNLSGDVGKEFNKALSCCQEKKLSLTTADLDGDQLLTAIRTQCPNIPDKLSMQLVQKIE